MKQLLTAIRWIVFIPLTILCIAILQVVFSLGHRLFQYLLFQDVPFPIILPTLIAVLIWCCGMTLTPIFACQIIAPRRKPASALLGVVLIVLMAFLLSNSTGFPTFVLVMHVLTSLCLGIGTIAAFVNGKKALAVSAKDEQQIAQPSPAPYSSPAAGSESGEA